MPQFAAFQTDLFADHGLDVELIESAPRAANIRRVAAQSADFCTTSVQHYLTARSEAGDLPARFVAIFGQKNTLGALVPADSPLSDPADLPGCRLGGSPEAPMVRGFQAGLSLLGLGPVEVVPTGDPVAAAFRSGSFDLAAATVDTVARNERHAGMSLRAVPLFIDAYMSGLVAGDHVPAPVAWRMRECLVDAFERQRKEPEAGVAALLRRHPDANADDAREGWLAVEPYLFCGREPGSMDAGGWVRAAAYAEQALDRRAPAVSTFYREDFCS